MLMDLEGNESKKEDKTEMATGAAQKSMPPIGSEPRTSIEAYRTGLPSEGSRHTVAKTAFITPLKRGRTRSLTNHLLYKSV